MNVTAAFKKDHTVFSQKLVGADKTPEIGFSRFCVKTPVHTNFHTKIYTQKIHDKNWPQSAHEVDDEMDNEDFDTGAEGNAAQVSAREAEMLRSQARCDALAMAPDGGAAAREAEALRKRTAQLKRTPAQHDTYNAKRRLAAAARIPK